MCKIPQKILYVLLGAIVVLAAQWGVEEVQAQQNRLRVHATAIVSRGELGSRIELLAVCDTGNGAMVYLAWNTTQSGGVAVLPNGCDKKK